MNYFNTDHSNDNLTPSEKVRPVEGPMQLPFELDPHIIHHIIYSQAGSIGKAVIELLMNAVDTDARAVRLSMAKDGFHCADDGKGFASRDDVIRYFGRFGTPHAEGDATYGRFRLGRGQIMAHASTVWRSNGWEMTVDTRAMGYHYTLEGLAAPLAGCSIAGRWYEPLSDSELMSAIQEIRDLVKYTPISVELNDRLITRDPRAEKWDAEDEFAYYRVKEEGAVSIYNQGVLVRHKVSGHPLGKRVEDAGQAPLSIDAHRWMRALRFEYYRVAQLRRLRVGEQLWVGRLDGPGISGDVPGVCEAYFERRRGGWSFHATWTICWRGRWRRAHILTFGEFHLKPGNRIEFANADDVRAEREFRRVCRYCTFFYRHTEQLGVPRRYTSECGHHHLWRGEVVGRNGYNRYGCEAPRPQGLAAVVETAMALGIIPGDSEYEP